jgi:hypothetical protein
MYLRKKILTILKEEVNSINSIRRGIDILDDEVIGRLNKVYTPQNIYGGDINLKEQISRILKEDRSLRKVLEDLINVIYNDFDRLQYNWADYNCGMGVCCDPYAIGFTLPSQEYDDYLFKLVNGEEYSDHGYYPTEMQDELPEECYEMPDITNPKFNTIIIYGELYDEISQYMGLSRKWFPMFIDIINERFGSKATKGYVSLI